MELLNKKVSHEKFGSGKIVEVNEKSIVVAFNDETKKFMYPDAFAHHLALEKCKESEHIHSLIEAQENAKILQMEQLKEQKELQQKRVQLEKDYEKLLNRHKLHPESQIVVWCEEDKDEIFENWTANIGFVKSGANTGKPNKAVRVYQNSAVVLTERAPYELEENRRIIGLYMVKKRFIGKLATDGNIPAHAVHKIQLTEEESEKLRFWNYYSNDKLKQAISWNSGKYRYLNNDWVAQMLVDICSLRTNEEERQEIVNFMQYFCTMNKIVLEDISEKNGSLMKV